MASECHGSRACYTSGCRCSLCKQANSGYQRDYRAGRRGTYSAKLAGYVLASIRPRVDTERGRPSIWGQVDTG